MFQFMEIPPMADEQSPSRETQEMERDELLEDSQNSNSRAGASAGACKIINTTASSGAAFTPTRSQILAAEMAEEFYGTQVTFVHADSMTFKSIVQELTGNGSKSNDLNPSTTSADMRSKHKIRSGPNSRSGVVQKSSRFKHPAGKRPYSGNEHGGLQALQLPDLTTDASLQVQMNICAPSSSSPAAVPSPVSPLGVIDEFENYSSGDGAQCSTDTQAHDQLDIGDGGFHDVDDTQGGVGFSFPVSLKEKNMWTGAVVQPKLLHLFPETPDHDERYR